MNQELESVIFVLQHISAQLEKPVFSKHRITKELKNAVKAQENSAFINILLHMASKFDVKDVDNVIEDLKTLDLELSHAVRHVDQVHIMVLDLIIKYRKNS